MKNLLITAIACAAAVITPAAAQNLEEIRERARFLEEYKTLISPNAEKSLRMAAIEEGLKSDDDLVRREAFDAAFDSNDSDLIFLGLRHFLKKRTQFTMELTLPDEPNAAEQNAYDRYSQTTFTRLAILENGEISFNGNYKGAFINKGFILNWGKCNLKITSVAKDVMSGTYACGADAVLPAKVLID